MKIAILSPISNPLPPISYAPWEKVVHTLAMGLYSKGIDVTVFAATDSEAKYKISSTVEKSLSNLEEFKFQNEMIHITKACSIIRNSDFDIIHNHLNWNGMLGLELTGKKFITTIHGFEPTSSFIFEKFKKNNYISISYAERKKSPELNYIANIYNGIDFNFFKLQERKDNYLFTAARICKEKGIHNAIELARQVDKNLYIAGIIQDQQYFEKEIKPAIDNKNIYYLGNLTQEKIYDYVSKAKAYISLLEWDEPFGLSVAEAIACGTPVIATKRGSMTELIKDMVSGILVSDTSEAVKRFKEIEKIPPKQCSDFGFSLFSSDKMVEEYLKAYQNILQGTKNQ